ncbi:hypothetical protein DYB25_012686 [Aphanomyces astaci]|uniref:Uncharacterized protein n=3 Tax=Aphanomyces astaci TaxID=112090 RepID=A0A396ZVX1_APHAT|nr:hypothetical protein DYB25_012686 [Aphanomyces astaci]RHY46161.1 hypothetical protein DYB34_014006 [Aphanomyces astaci]
MVYSILAQYMSESLGLVVSSIPPTLYTLGKIVQERVCDAISTLSVASILLSAVICDLTDDARLLLVKDSVFTVGFGITYWASLCSSEDLLWSYQRRFRGTADTAELRAKYAQPHIRSVSRFMCKVWGSALIVEAGVRLALIYAIPVQVMPYVSTGLMVVMFVSLFTWTAWYRRTHHQSAVGAVVDETGANEPLLL